MDKLMNLVGIPWTLAQNQGQKRPPPPQGSPFGLLDYKVAIIKHHLYTFTYNKYYDGNVENQ